MKGIPAQYLNRKPRHPFNCSPNELKKVRVRALAHKYEDECDAHRFECIECRKRWIIYMPTSRKRLPHGYWQCRGKQCNCGPQLMQGGR